MIFKTTGKSMKELLEIYGTGSSGFFPQNWYKNETFFTKKPEAGEYDIEFNTSNINQTYGEQTKGLKKDFQPIHPAILCEAILSHYKETGDRLLENIYSRTSAFDSDGGCVSVGFFGARGLYVDYFWDDNRGVSTGLSGARKLETGKLEDLKSIKDLTLDLAIKKVKNAGYKIIKEI